MSRKSVFLSAVSRELGDMRSLLDTAFSRHFDVITQERSLNQHPGRGIREVLAEAIAEADCVIHLAGRGFGATADAPFPEHPGFTCSWTQFEYYHAHLEGKPVFALICGPSLADPAFVETADTVLGVDEKTRLQREHCARVVSGRFEDTPFTGLPRTANNREEKTDREALLESAISICAQMAATDPAYSRVQADLQDILASLARIEKGQKHLLRRSALALAALALIGGGVWLVKRDTGEVKQEQRVAKQETADQLFAIQKTLDEIKQGRDPSLPPLTREKLEEELATRLGWSIGKLRSTLAAAQAGDDLLAKAIADLAEGRDAEASAGFDQVIAAEEESVRRLRSAYDGKASIAFEKGNYREALEWYEKSAALIDKASAPLEWADAQDYVAVCLHHSAEYARAEPLMREILAQRETHLSAEDPAIATAINNLAQLYVATNRFAQAEHLMERALAIDEKAYGKDQPEVTTRLNNLATLYLYTNRLELSEIFMERVLRIEESAHSDDHPDIASALNNLASLYRDTNRLAQAESMMERALRIDQSAFGENHPVVARDLNNLGQLYMETNRFEDAEPLIRHVLHINEITYGMDHPKVATSLLNLADFYHAANRLNEAGQLLNRALAIHEATHGKNHPDVATVLNNLAQVYKDEDRLTEAELLLERALAIDEAAYGENHPDVSIRLNNLALIYKDTNRPKDAELLLQRALAIDEAAYGRDNPKVAIVLNSLAQLYQATNRLKEAEPLMERVADIFQKAYGKDHPNVAAALNNLGMLYKATNRLREAELLMERSLAIDEAAYGKSHPMVSIRLNNLASIYRVTNRLAQAMPLMERSLAIDEAVFGNHHSQVASGLNNLAQLLDDLGKREEAQPMYRRGIAILIRYETVNRHEHPDLLARVRNYRRAMKELGLDTPERKRRLSSLGLEAELEQAEWDKKLAELFSPADEASSSAMEAYRKGDHAAALRLWSQALDFQKAAGTPDAGAMRITRMNIASCRVFLGEHAAARDELQAIITELEEAETHDSLAARARHHLARAMVALDEKPAAIAALREALAIYKELPADQASPAQIKESEDLLKELQR